MTSKKSLSPRTVKSSSHLIVSCAHLGMSKKILSVLSQVAKYYGPEVYHLGQLITSDEKKMFEVRTHKIRTWEKENIEKEKFCKKNGLDVPNQYYTNIDKIEIAKGEIASIVESQELRISALQDVFGSHTQFIINDEQHVPSMFFRKTKTKSELMLGTKLLLSSVSANGERVAHSPITPKSFNYFKSKAHSFVIPHPTGALKSFNKEGINQAHVMVTTGSLMEIPEIKRASEQYRVNNQAGAVMVLVDNETGAFHIKRLKIESYAKGFICIDDGMVFTETGKLELKSEDCGVFSTDDHAPYEHLGVLGSVIGLGQLHNASLFVNGGDASDMGSVCRHNKGKPLLQENKRIKNDLASLKRLLDAQASIPSLKRQVMLDSNHAEWLTHYVQENPALVGLLDWKSIKDDYFPAWEVMLREDQGIFKFGDLVIRHGDKEAGLVGGHKTFSKYLCGHYHAHNEYLTSASAGAGCGLGPKYLEGAVTAWTNTITSLSKYNGVASFNIKTVLHDEVKKKSTFAYRNQIFEFPFHSYK